MKGRYGGLILPAGPLEAAIRRAVEDRADPMRGINSLFGPVLARSWWKARSAGRVSAVLADRICVEKLGCHPIEVYGDAWLA